MSVQLQAVVQLDKSAFASGLSSMSQLTANMTGAMSMAFQGVASEVYAMSRAFGPMGAAVSVLKEATTVGVGFEQQIANVASVSGLMGDELKKVEENARELAKTTRFTASEASEALYSLASAGISGADALNNALGPALLLAGATLSSTQMATEAMTAAMANFKLPAEEATRIADQFVGAIASSPATMERLSEAMKYAGPAAAGFGVSLEKAVAEVAAFHQVGLRGEMAGTSFRMALVQLTKAVADGKAVIAPTLKDWNAATEGVTGAVRRLNAAGVDTKDVILALGARAGPGVAALMKLGADAMDDLAARITRVANVSKVYETQLNTLSGRFAILKSAMEEVSLKIFAAIAPALTELTEKMTVAVDWVGALSKALFTGDWAGAAAQITDLWGKIQAGAAAFDWMSALDQAREMLAGLIDRAFEFGQRIADWAGLSNTFEAIRGLFETLKVSAGMLLDAINHLFGAFRDDGPGVLERSIKLLDTALSGLIEAADLAISSVNKLVQGWKSLSNDTQALILIIAGGAGITYAITTFTTATIAATAAAIAHAVALKAQLVSACETGYIKMMLFGDAIKSVTLAQAGMVAGAAALGYGLGTLIRQIPGVADALDNLAVKTGQWLGLVEKEDMELKRNLEELKAKRKAMQEAAAAQKENTVEIEAANLAIGEQVMQQRELGSVMKTVTDAIMPLAPAVREVKKEVELATGFWNSYQKSSYEANRAMMESAITFKQFAPASADLVEAMEKTGVALSDAAEETDEAKYSFKDLWGMLGKFKELKITTFDVSGFVDNLKLLKQKLGELRFSDITLPDFSGFELPKITRDQAGKFADAMQLLKQRMVNLKFDEIKMPDMRSLWRLPNITGADVDSFLKSMDKLKAGMLKLDFGSLGQMNIDIKGGGADAVLNEIVRIRTFMEAKNGLLWA